MIARGDDSIPAAAAGAGLSHASLPPQADRHRAGRLGADPYEIAQRYALGHIPRDEMIAALAAWPYAQDFIPSNYWDDLGRRLLGRRRAGLRSRREGPAA